MGSLERFRKHFGRTLQTPAPLTRLSRRPSTSSTQTIIRTIQLIIYRTISKLLDSMGSRQCSTFGSRRSWPIPHRSSPTVEVMSFPMNYEQHKKSNISLTLVVEIEGRTVKISEMEQAWLKDLTYRCHSLLPFLLYFAFNYFITAIEIILISSQCSLGGYKALTALRWRLASTTSRLTSAPSRAKTLLTGAPSTWITICNTLYWLYL